MIFQIQTLAIAGRVGGPGGQPEDSQTLSSGLNWANFHLFNIYGSDSSNSSSARRAGEGHQSACDAHRYSDTDLASTGVICVGCQVLAFIARTLVNKLVSYYKAKKDIKEDHVLFPFPSWETPLFLFQTLGLSEASFDAIASNCAGYQVAAGCVLIIMLVVMGVLLYFTYQALHQEGHCEWEDRSWEDSKKEARETLQDSKGKGILARVLALNSAFKTLMTRGEWKQMSGDHRFYDKYGSALHGTTHGDAWWWCFWEFLRVVLIAWVFSSVAEPVVNAAVILGILVFDIIIMIRFHPFGSWSELFKHWFRSLLNIGIFACVLGFINGDMVEDTFNEAFLTLSSVSIVPLLIAALIQPIIQLSQLLNSAAESCKPGDVAKLSADAAAVGANGAADVENGNTASGPAVENANTASAPDLGGLKSLYKLDDNAAAAAVAATADLPHQDGGKAEDSDAKDSSAPRTALAQTPNFGQAFPAGMLQPYGMMPPMMNVGAPVPAVLPAGLPPMNPPLGLPGATNNMPMTSAPGIQPYAAFGAPMPFASSIVFSMPPGP